jgi:hypothetical protein
VLKLYWMNISNGRFQTGDQCHERETGPFLPTHLEFLVATFVERSTITSLNFSEPLPASLLALCTVNHACQHYPAYAAHRNAFDV